MIAPQCIHLNSILSSLSFEVEAHCHSPPRSKSTRFMWYWSVNQYLVISLNTFWQNALTSISLNKIWFRLFHNILLPAQWKPSIPTNREQHDEIYEIRHELRPQFICNESFHASEVGFHHSAAELIACGSKCSVKPLKKKFQRFFDCEMKADGMVLRWMWSKYELLGFTFSIHAWLHGWSHRKHKLFNTRSSYDGFILKAIRDQDQPMWRLTWIIRHVLHSY